MFLQKKSGKFPDLSTIDLLRSYALLQFVDAHSVLNDYLDKAVMAAAFALFAVTFTWFIKMLYFGG